LLDLDVDAGATFIKHKLKETKYSKIQNSFDPLKYDLSMSLCVIL